MFRDTDIAIVGMAGRFPKSPTIREFASNIIKNKDCISRTQFPTPSAFGYLEDFDCFDSQHFNIPDTEAELLDPQHRIMMEVVWHALEDAGLHGKIKNPEEVVSIYLGCAPSSYLNDNIPESLTKRFQALISNLPDFIATRIAYTFNFRGESMLVGTGCSSSLVAVHLGCQSLLSGQSTISIAGGVALLMPGTYKTSSEEGMIVSPTGYCRPFDASATGFVPANGGGVVILKTAESAYKDGDHIHAIIRASALNNDGSSKAGFMAPSPEGQSELITTALSLADIPVESISFVETHGTGTKLGDPIEFDGLNQAYQEFTKAKNFCALGSLKANFGHLDRAAGIAGLIKAVICIKNRRIPSLKGFERLNPEIPLEGSPFYIPTAEVTFPDNGSPLRAAVSAFGVGGTNSHVIIESVPSLSLPHDNRTHIITFSGQSIESAERTAKDLGDTIINEPEVSLANIAITRNVLRHQLPVRGYIVSSNRADFAKSLQELSLKNNATKTSPKIAFLFPGHGGSSWAGSSFLYEEFPVFKKHIDQCDLHSMDLLGIGLKELIAYRSEINPNLKMSIAQPLLFAIESGLCVLLETLGIYSVELLGHSMGEITAAWKAGTILLADALQLLYKRGELLDRQSGGKMLSVRLSEEKLVPYITEGVELSVFNSQYSSVLSGSKNAIEALQKEFEAKGVDAHILNLELAAHSSQLDPILDEFEASAAKIHFRPAENLWMSNVSEQAIGQEPNVDGTYWRTQLRAPVRFYQCVQALLQKGITTFIEVGPGQMLTSLVTEIALEAEIKVTIISLMPKQKEAHKAVSCFLTACGEIWSQGSEIKWENLYTPATVQAGWTDLPLYPFHRRRFRKENRKILAHSTSILRQPNPGKWLYEEEWIEEVDTHQSPRTLKKILVDTNVLQVLPSLVCMLEDLSISVKIYQNKEELHHLIDVNKNHSSSDLLSIIDAGSFLLKKSSATKCFLELLHPYQGTTLENCHWYVLSQDRFQVIEGDKLKPEQSLLTGIERVLPQEHAGAGFTSIDISSIYSHKRDTLLLVNELSPQSVSRRIALRKGSVFVPQYRPASPSSAPIFFSKYEVVVITGGAGKVGQVLAQTVLRVAPQAKVIYLNRSISTAKNDYISDYIACNVADPDQLQNALNIIYSRYGRIDTIIHAAAFVDSQQFLSLQELTHSSVQEMFAAKINGAINISNLTSEFNVKNVIACSSISTEIGGLRFGAYVAANSMLDALTLRNNSSTETRWTTINWDVWDFNDSTDYMNPTLLKLALKPAEGSETFLRVLAAEGPRIIVSTSNLDNRIQHVSQMFTSASMETHFDESLPKDPAKVICSHISKAFGKSIHDTNITLRSLGFDSLSTMQLLVKLRHELNILLPISSAIGSQTINGLIKRCILAMENDQKSSFSPLSPIAQRKSKPSGIYKASSIQRRWYKVISKNFGYLDLPIRLFGNLNHQALRDAIIAVSNRHSVLRTTYTEDAIDIWQNIYSEYEPELKIIDFSSLSSTEAINNLEILIKNECERTFDITKQVPFSAQLISLSSSEHILHIHMHHILMDGVSSSVYLKDLGCAYDYFINKNNDLIWKTIPVQYCDYAEWQRNYLEGSNGALDRLAWSRHLGSSQGYLAIKGDLPGDPSDNLGEQVSFLLDKQIVSGLAVLQSETETSLFNVLLALYAAFLYKVTKNPNCLIGTTLAGRHHPDVHDTVGVFVTPMPIFIKVEQDESLHSLITSASAVMAHFHEHQLCPLEDLVTSVEPFTRTDINETFRVYILMQNYPRTDPRLGSIPYYEETKYDYLFRQEVMRDFELIINPVNGSFQELNCSFVYRKCLYSRQFVESLRNCFISLLMHIQDYPSNISLKLLLDKI